MNTFVTVKPIFFTSRDPKFPDWLTQYNAALQRWEPLGLFIMDLCGEFDCRRNLRFCAVCI